MILILLIFIGGIGLGFFLRNRQGIKGISSRMTSLFLFLMIFSMGAVIGKNKTIVLNLKELGFEALVIAIGAIAGSILFVSLVQKLFKPVR